MSFPDIFPILFNLPGFSEASEICNYLLVSKTIKLLVQSSCQQISSKTSGTLKCATLPNLQKISSNIELQLTDSNCFPQFRTGTLLLPKPLLSKLKQPARRKTSGIIDQQFQLLLSSLNKILTWLTPEKVRILDSDTHFDITLTNNRIQLELACQRYLYELTITECSETMSLFYLNCLRQISNKYSKYQLTINKQYADFFQESGWWKPSQLDII